MVRIPTRINPVFAPVDRMRDKWNFPRGIFQVKVSRLLGIQMMAARRCVAVGLPVLEICRGLGIISGASDNWRVKSACKIAAVVPASKGCASDFELLKSVR